jgi:lipopolysaccharide assembly outer membrane protein LptD (OstA)
LVRLRVAIALSALAAFALCPPRESTAQYQPPSEKLQITARSAATWAGVGEDVIQLEGPVTIETDRARLSAQRAVIWLRPSTAPAAPPGTQRAEVILVGDAEVAHMGALRTGPRLAVTAEVAGEVQITAQDRRAADLSWTPEYREAAALRRATLPRPTTGPATGPATREATEPEPPPPPPPKIEPVRVVLPGEIDTNYVVDGKVAVVISGGITLMQHADNGDFITFQARRAVLFTRLDKLSDSRNLDQVKRLEDAITGAYLEGDVRVTQTPTQQPGKPPRPDYRFRAHRIYYDFATKRAVLTDAVVHTTEPEQQIPVIIRAKLVRQLSEGEFKARGVELSTSSFALPSYSVAAESVYVRRVETGDPQAGDRTVFSADNPTFRMFGVPVFWLPAAGGELTERGIPLRSASLVNSSKYGLGARTEWGLFETLGRPPPRDVDVSYKLDYFGDRGPAFGVDAEYSGGFITETSKQRWGFIGDLESYFVYDRGEDNFGRLPTRLDHQEELRGQALFEHQHFFPGDWQAQLRLGYLSDPTFMEEWFRRDFNQGDERDVSLYLKHQRDTEAATFLVDLQPNNLVTTAEMMQEQVEIERVPEFGYHRIGDGAEFRRGPFPTSGVTFISDNTLSGLRFNRTGATLREQGFPEDGGLSPGLPSVGQTGVDNGTTYRGDFRQELDFPFSAGQFRILPYLVGRYTGYSDSPGGGQKHRLFGGAGARVSTAFWKVFEGVESRTFDLHRMRHVVEPELNVFTSGTSVNRDELFLYDEPIDSIYDVSAVSLALRQGWQPARGGPAPRRSVDFFSINIEASFYSNEPETELPPQQFRGLYFASLPEASVPREALNADATWRISDTTAALADAQYNLDENELATLGVGLLVQRDARMTYLLTGRRIEVFDSSIMGIAATYELSPKYTVSVGQNYDFSQSENVSSAVEFRRRFDTFFMSFTYTYSLVDEQSGFAINIYPTWWAFRGLDQTAFSNALGGRRRR